MKRNRWKAVFRVLGIWLGLSEPVSGTTTEVPTGIGVMHDTQRRLAAIMFTDIVGYSSLTHKDEALTLALLAEHRDVVRPLFPQHGGREIKTMGDGFLIEFSSALEAVRCGIVMQQALKARNEHEPNERQIEIRIGIHLGDLEEMDGDVYGDGVNIASRIEPLAPSGGICVSQQVYDQVHNKLDVPLVKLGRGELKNIQTPITIYRVVLPGEPVPRPWSSRFLFTLKKKRTRALMTGGVVVSLLILTGYLGWQNQRSGFLDLPLNRIGILPCDNLNSDTTEVYFVEGLHDDIISRLSRNPALQVIAKSSMMRYENADKTIREIGEELGAGSLLECSVRTLADELRVSARLIKSKTEVQLWAEIYNRKTDDIYWIISQIAQAVAEAVGVTVAAQDKELVETPPTQNIVADDTYKKARFFLHKMTESEIQKSIDLFREAINLDPNFAEAYAGLAQAYSLQGTFEDKVRNYAEEAVALDDMLSEAHTSLGFSIWRYDRDPNKAIREFERAISSNPSDAFAHILYGLLLSALGRHEAAFEKGQVAIEVDPVNASIRLALGQIYFFARRYDEAIRQAQEAIDLENGGFSYAHALVGMSNLQMGRFDQAISSFERALEVIDKPPPSTFQKPVYDPNLELYQASRALANQIVYFNYYLGLAYAMMGRREEAMKVIEELKSQGWTLAYEIALIYTALNENDAALMWLQRALLKYPQFPMTLEYVNVDPRLDRLHPESRFVVVVAQMGLVP